MPCSALASGMRSSRSSSFSACFSASSGMPGLFDGLAQLGDLGAGAFALAKLLLNLAKLLAQDVLALAALQRFLGLLADLLGQAQDLDLLREDSATACRGARWTSKVSSRSCFSAGVRSETLAMKSASADGD